MMRVSPNENTTSPGDTSRMGKFRKERDVPVQPDARVALEEQLEEDGKLWTPSQQVRLQWLRGAAVTSCGCLGGRGTDDVSLLHDLWA
jgi:hypothetical protein